MGVVDGSSIALPTAKLLAWPRSLLLPHRTSSVLVVWSCPRSAAPARSGKVSPPSQGACRDGSRNEMRSIDGARGSTALRQVSRPGATRSCSSPANSRPARSLAAIRSAASTSAESSSQPQLVSVPRGLAQSPNPDVLAAESARSLSSARHVPSRDRVGDHTIMAVHH